MFAYAFAKGERKGFFDRSYRATAQQAFDGLVKDYLYFDDEGKLYMDQTVKIGTLNVKTSRGDYDYYITTERRINDYKGLASLLYLSQELD
jgi:unsaturated rhamnogalacturonyl hydrolase